MIRWIAVAAMVGLVTGGAGRLAPAEAQAGVEHAIYNTGMVDLRFIVVTSPVDE